MITCTKCGTAQPFTALRNVRPWADAELDVGECQQPYGDGVCNSTLAREWDALEIDTIENSCRVIEVES